MNAKRVFIPIAFVTCASLGIVPAVYADVPSAQVTPLEGGVAVVGGVLGTDYTMDAATRGRCRRGYRPRFLRDSLQRALTRKGPGRASTLPRPKTSMYIPRPKIRYRRSSPTVHRWWLRATLYLSGVLHLLGLLRLTLHIMSDMVNRHGREAGLGEETYEY